MKTDSFSLKKTYIFCFFFGMIIHIMSWFLFPKVGEYWTSYICDGLFLFNYGHPKTLAACQDKNTNEIYNITLLYIVLLSILNLIYSAIIFLFVLAGNKIMEKVNKN